MEQMIQPQEVVMIGDPVQVVTRAWFAERRERVSTQFVIIAPMDGVTGRVHVPSIGGVAEILQCWAVQDFQLFVGKDEKREDVLRALSATGKFFTVRDEGSHIEVEPAGLELAPTHLH